MASTSGIRITGLTQAVTLTDLKVYFSNPRNGGGKIAKIYHPLRDYDAIVLFENGTRYEDLFSRNHIIKNQKIKIHVLKKKIYTKVSVELEPEVTLLLDQDSAHLDNLQFDGELDVNFDPTSMNYTMVGDWFQVEWAWHYLHNAIGKTENSIGETEPILDVQEPSTEEAHRVPTKPEVIWNIGPTPEKPESETACKDNTPVPTERHVIGSNSSDSSSYNDLSPEVPASRLMFPYDRKSNTIPRDAGLDLLANPLQARGNHHYRGNPFDYASDDSDEFDVEAMERRFANYMHMNRHGCGEQDFERFKAPKRAPSPPNPDILHSEFGDIPLTYETTFDTVEVKLLLADILKEKGDAIVNPTNKDLSHTYGISHSISRMAGRSLQEECRSYIQRQGQMSMGDVMHTCAGGALDKRVGFVLHCVPPSWREEESESTTHILTCTYLNCLQYANRQLWLQQLSVPLLGSGGMGIPLDVSVQAFYDAILLHTSDEKRPRHLQTVHLVSNMQESTCSMIVVMRSLMELNYDESLKAAMDRYISRSEQFEFKANEFWLDSNATCDEKPKSSNEGDTESSNPYPKTVDEEKDDEFGDDLGADAMAKTVIDKSRGRKSTEVLGKEVEPQEEPGTLDRNILTKGSPLSDTDDVIISNFEELHFDDESKSLRNPEPKPLSDEGKVHGDCDEDVVEERPPNAPTKRMEYEKSDEKSNETMDYTSQPGCLETIEHKDTEPLLFEDESV